VIIFIVKESGSVAWITSKVRKNIYLPIADEVLKSSGVANF
jgi:hypothetical protein